MPILKFNNIELINPAILPTGGLTSVLQKLKYVCRIYFSLDAELKTMVLKARHESKIFMMFSAKSLMVVLLIYHLIFAAVAYQFAATTWGDAHRYWFVGQDLAPLSFTAFVRPGTDLVNLFTFPLVWSGFIIFSLFSAVGLFLLYKIIKEGAGTSVWSKAVAMVLLLLPNLHFWTSTIGKEALIFVPLMIMAFEIHRKKFCSLLLLSALVMLTLIRPHVALVVAASYVLALLLTQQLSGRQKTLVGAGLVAFGGLSLWLLTNIQDFAGGFSRVLRKYEAHITHFRTTDGNVPLDQYALPYKIFTFYFRPLPFEKNGLLYSVISIENAILLLLFIIAMVQVARHFAVLKKSILVVFPVILLLMLGVMYVYAYANYGIIMRTLHHGSTFYV